MSNKVFVAKKKKKILSEVKNDRSESTLLNKKPLIVKTNRSNVCRTENSSDEETDGNLEIFQTKTMKKKISLPSLSTLLLPSNKDMGVSSLMDNSIEKSYFPKVGKYPLSYDIFTSKDTNSTSIGKKKIDERTSSPLDTSYKKTNDYSISHMFSDGLSDEENSRHEFEYVDGSDKLKTDLIPSAVNIGSRKSGQSSGKVNECKKQKQVPKDLIINRPAFSNPESKLISTNFKSNKQIGETENSFERNDSTTVNKGMKILAQKPMRKSSSTLILSSKKDYGITSLMNKSIDESQQPFIVRVDGNSKSSSVKGIYERSIDRLNSGMFDDENDRQEIIYDSCSDESEIDLISGCIRLTLSECNLDDTTNSQNSIEALNKNDFSENRSDLMAEQKSVFGEGTRVNCNENENLELSGLMSDAMNCIGNDAVVITGEANNTSQTNFQSSDPFNEEFNIGSHLSGYRNISLSPYESESEFSQNYTMSFGDNSLIYQKSRRSSFDIPQSVYLKQKGPFLSRKKIKDNTVFTFKPWNLVSKKVSQYKPERQLSSYQNRKHTSKYKYTSSNKGNQMQFLFSQKQSTSYDDCGKKCIDINTEKWAPNLTNKCFERRYPIDESFDFSNIETNNTLNMYEKDIKATINIDAVKSTWSENRHTSVDPFLNTCSKGSNISDEIMMNRSFSSNFWQNSHRVQTFVKEFLDKENETYSKIPKRSMDRERLSLKRRWLDVDDKRTIESSSAATEERIDIDPQMLLSNYSCEYNRAYMNKRFEPELNLPK